MESPLGVHLTKSTVGRVAAWIYGTDLPDACFGALLAGAILIPVLGVPLTCFALAITAFAGLVLLLLQGGYVCRTHPSTL